MTLKSKILLIGCLLLAAVSLLGQSVTSTLIGSVTDQSSAAVPGAHITLTDTATGGVVSAESDSAGVFRFLDMKPAAYSLRIQRQGFKQVDIDNIQLASSEIRNLGKIVLEVGSAAESVTVTAESTPVQISSSDRSALVDSNQLNDISLKGRDAYGYLALIPGVVDTDASRDIAGNTSQFYVNINGMVGNSKNVTFDGVTGLDPGGNFSAYLNLNPDAISEIKVLTNGYEAEFGRSGGGSVNMITKSGTSQFHGSGYWARRHEDMNANSFFNNRQGIARPLYRYNIGGITLGGPAYIPKLFNKDRRRLFFFASQERDEERIPTSTAVANMPTPLELSGDFSQTRSSTGSVVTISDPVTRVPLPGDKIPASSLNAIGLGLLKVLPSPTGYVNPAPGQQYSANYLASMTPDHNRSDTIVRIDWPVTSKMNAYYRFAEDNDTAGQAFTVTTGTGGGNVIKLGRQHTAHVVNTLSPTAVNEFTFGFGGINTTYTGDDTASVDRTAALNPPTLRPLPAGPLYGNYLPSLAFSGGVVQNRAAFSGNAELGANSVYPFGAVQSFMSLSRTLSFQDDFTKVVGAHRLKAGLYVERTHQISSSAGASYNGRFNFGSTSNNPLDGGDGYANALLGVFQTYTEASNRAPAYCYFWENEFYVEDSWHASQRLTIDIGVRGYHYGQFKETAGAFAAFYPSLWDPSKAAVLYQPTLVNNRLVALNPITGQTTYQSLIATVIPGTGVVANGMRIDGKTGKNDQGDFPFLAFTPRVGFAWDVLGNGKFSVRGSFGQFINRGLLNTFSNENGAVPVVYTPIIYYTTMDQIANAANSEVFSPTSGTTWDGPQKLETSTQTNLTVQRSIGFGTVVEAAYVMNLDRHAQQTLQLNPIPEFAYANPANIVSGAEISQDLLRSRYRGMSSLTASSDSLSSLNYHSLQTQVQRRALRGLGYGMAYTFSKALGTSGWDPYNNQRQRYYGPLSQDRTHALTFNYSYALPTPGGHKALRAVFGGWNLSGIVTYQSGAPVTPSCSYTGSGLTVGQSDPSLSGVTARCQLVGDLHAFNHDFNTNFNTSALTVASAGTFGTLGVGVLRQPSWGNLDTSLAKRVPFGKEGRRALSIRIETYNTVNHAEFSSISTSMALTAAGKNNTTTYGQYTDTRPPRQLSTTLRFEF